MSSSVTLWAIAHQFPVWDSSGKNVLDILGCCALLQGIFLTRIKPTSLTFPTLAGGFFTTRATSEAHC